MAKMKDITVKVVRYDNTIAFQQTYKAVNFADADKQMRKDYKLRLGIDHHITCEYTK